MSTQDQATLIGQELERKLSCFRNYDPVSPSDTYVIYDQFHINTPSHFSETVKGWASALDRYKFHKVFHPECVLGLCTLEYYNHKMES